MAQKYSAVWIVREARRLLRSRLQKEQGWLTKARIDEIEKSLIEAGDYCFDDTTVLLGEYIIESRRLRAQVAARDTRIAEYLATIANQDRLVDAQEADIKKLEAERDRLQEALVIEIREALAGKEKA